MTKKNQNIEIYQGENIPINFDVITSEGTDKDLTSSQIEWVVFKTGSTDNVIKKTLADNQITIDGKRATIILEEADTVNLLNGYRHELRIIDSNLQSRVSATGSFVILNSQTR